MKRNLLEREEDNDPMSVVSNLFDVSCFLGDNNCYDVK